MTIFLKYQANVYWKSNFATFYIKAYSKNLRANSYVNLTTRIVIHILTSRKRQNIDQFHTFCFVQNVKEAEKPAQISFIALGS